MSHTYISNFIHCVFSTKERRKIIAPEIKERLWFYMGGIARKHKAKIIAIGGTEDHVHLLLSMPTTLSVAKIIQLIKSGSSKWIHDTFPSFRHFEWQEGFGVFTVSYEDINSTTDYINNQERHHKKETFDEEYIAFLKEAGIDYDERYVLG
jgi:putative transposase